MEGWREIISLLDKHPSFAVALASLISVLIAGSFSILTTLAMRRSDMLKTRADIAVRIGLEVFRQTIDVTKSTSNNLDVFPPEFWILSSLKLAELLHIKNINTETATCKIEEAIKFSKEIQKVIEKHSQQDVQADVKKPNAA